MFVGSIKNLVIWNVNNDYIYLLIYTKHFWKRKLFLTLSTPWAAHSAGGCRGRVATEAQGAPNWVKSKRMQLAIQKA